MDSKCPGKQFRSFSNFILILFLSTPEGILNHREIISKRKTFGSERFASECGSFETSESLKHGGHSGEALCLI